MRRFLPFIITGLVFVVAAGGGLLLFRIKNSTTPLRVAEGKPGAEPNHVRGGKNARVTIEEFGDYQCTPCGKLAQVLRKVEQTYGDRVRLVFRQFPLINMHAYALTAASAAEAAGLQGHFWEMHDQLFETATTWAKDMPRPRRAPLASPPNVPPDDVAANAVKETFVGFAVQIGLDQEKFKKDMESEEVKLRITADQQRGASMGVDRTPVLLINGVQIPFSSLKFEPLQKLIDDALNGKTPVPETPSPTASSSP